jgi:hypothetical protein
MGMEEVGDDERESDFSEDSLECTSPSHTNNINNNDSNNGCMSTSDAHKETDSNDVDTDSLESNRDPSDGRHVCVMKMPELEAEHAGSSSAGSSRIWNWILHSSSYSTGSPMALCDSVINPDPNKRQKMLEAARHIDCTSQYGYDYNNWDVDENVSLENKCDTLSSCGEENSGLKLHGNLPSGNPRIVPHGPYMHDNLPVSGSAIVQHIEPCIHDENLRGTVESCDQHENNHDGSGVISLAHSEPCVSVDYDTCHHDEHENACDVNGSVSIERKPEMHACGPASTQNTCNLVTVNADEALFKSEPNLSVCGNISLKETFQPGHAETETVVVHKSNFADICDDHYDDIKRDDDDSDQNSESTEDFQSVGSEAGDERSQENKIEKDIRGPDLEENVVQDSDSEEFESVKSLPLENGELDDELPESDRLKLQQAPGCEDGERKMPLPDDNKRTAVLSPVDVGDVLDCQNNNDDDDDDHVPANSSVSELSHPVSCVGNQRNFAEVGIMQW